MAGGTEALVLGVKAGVNSAIIVKILSFSYDQTMVIDVMGMKIVKDDFKSGFRYKFHYKDLNTIMKTALDY